MSGMSMYLMWPHDGPVPDIETAQDRYDEIAPIDLNEDLCEWLTSYVAMGDCCEIARRHNLKPFLAFHIYAAILDENRLPDGPWFTPGEMADAAETVLSMLGNGHPDAIALRSAYVARSRHWRPDLDPYRRGLIAANEIKGFIRMHEAVMHAARHCGRDDIDRVALGVFDIFG